MSVLVQQLLNGFFSIHCNHSTNPYYDGHITHSLSLSKEQIPTLLDSSTNSCAGGLPYAVLPLIYPRVTLLLHLALL